MKKVVIVDDEPFILMMVEDKLKRAGFSVITSRESIKAVDIIKRERPDLVILDWMMPEMSGLQVCKNIKADPALSSIPVFMLTAKGQSEDEERGLQQGIARYITKPFSPRALLDAVIETIGTAG